MCWYGLQLKNTNSNTSGNNISEVPKYTFRNQEELLEDLSKYINKRNEDVKNLVLEEFFEDKKVLTMLDERYD